MFDRWGYSILREEAGDTDAGGGTATVTETAEQKELRETREELAAEKRRNTELQASEREWSERALRAQRQPEPEDREERVDREATEEELETGEKLLDDVSKDGLKALLKRGIPTIKQMRELINESVQAAVGEGRHEQQYQQVMNDEFPEMNADLARVNKGLKPESELFVLAAEIYRDAYDLDPELKGKKSALIMATRQAAAQLQLQGKRKVESEADRQASRRARIGVQKPDRSSKSDAAEETGLNEKQRSFAASMGVSEDSYIKQQEVIRGKRGK